MAASGASAAGRVAGQAGQSARVLREVKGVVNIPSRSIAAVLLRAGGKPMPHKELFAKAQEYKLLHSKRHFKQVLKMMRIQGRVGVHCLPPEEIGGSKRTFTVVLTRKGEQVYREVLGEDVPPPEAESQSGGEKRGLADALE